MQHLILHCHYLLFIYKMLYILTMMSWSICTEQYAWEQGVARMGDMHTATLPGQHSLLEELSSRKSHSPQAAVVFRGSCGGGFFFLFLSYWMEMITLVGMLFRAGEVFVPLGMLLGRLAARRHFLHLLSLKNSVSLSNSVCILKIIYHSSTPLTSACCPFFILCVKATSALSLQTCM